MRRALPVLAAAVGAFLLVGAFALRFYAYPKLAVAPVAQDSTTRLIGRDARIFDLTTLKEISTDLTTVARTVGDVAAAGELSDDVRVWVNTSSTRSSDGVVRKRQVERVAFDATTGEAIDCCGDYLETEKGEPRSIRHRGLVFKFPFETEQRAYSWWDATLREAVPAEFEGIETLEGLTVYRFESDIPRSRVAAHKVPGNLVDVHRRGNVKAQEMYANHRTFWVEPHTGVIIDRREKVTSTLAYRGEDRLTLTKVATQYTDDTVTHNVEKYGTLGKLLGLVQGPVPWAMGLAGVLLLALGTIFQFRNRVRAWEREPRERGRAGGRAPRGSVHRREHAV
jgi:hypothetical protein